MWLLDAFGAAFTNAAFGIEQKRISKSGPALLLAAWTRFWTLPLTILCLFLFPASLHLHSTFWLYLAICGILTAVGTTLTYYSYQRIDFALAFPLLSISPAVALLSAWIIDRTPPSLVGACGVGLVAIGTFLLTQGTTSRTPPLRNPGTWAILATAVIYSVTTCIDKLGVTASSPVQWALAINLAILALQIPAWFITRRRLKKPRKSARRLGASTAVLCGTLGAAVMLFQMFCLSSGGYVPYLLAIKQLSVLIALVASWYALHEKRSLSRFASAIVVTIGVVIIAMS